MDNPNSSSSGRWNRRGGGIGMEDNMLAMLDASEAQDAFDDRNPHTQTHLLLLFFF